MEAKHSASYPFQAAQAPRAASLSEPFLRPVYNSQKQLKPDGTVTLPLLTGTPLASAQQLPANHHKKPPQTGLHFKEHSEKLTLP